LPRSGLLGPPKSLLDPLALLGLALGMLGSIRCQHLKLALGSSDRVLAFADLASRFNLCRAQGTTELTCAYAATTPGIEPEHGPERQRDQSDDLGAVERCGSRADDKQQREADRRVLRERAAELNAQLLIRRREHLRVALERPAPYLPLRPRRQRHPARTRASAERPAPACALATRPPRPPTRSTRPRSPQHSPALTRDLNRSRRYSVSSVAQAGSQAGKASRVAHWRLAVANQFVPALMLVALREFFALQAELERQSEHGDDAPLATADVARVIAFLGALAVGGAWSFGGLAAVGCWLVTGRGPGGQLLASGFESGAGGRHGLQTLVAQSRRAASD
jgi:hypothetical protein